MKDETVRKSKVGLRAQNADSDDSESDFFGSDNSCAVPVDKTAGVVASGVRETVAACLHPFAVVGPLLALQVLLRNDVVGHVRVPGLRLPDARSPPRTAVRTDHLDRPLRQPVPGEHPVEEGHVLLHSETLYPFLTQTWQTSHCTC